MIASAVVEPPPAPPVEPPKPIALAPVPERHRRIRRGLGHVSIPAGAPAAVLALKSCQCRWPSGDPRGADFAYCCDPTEPGDSYCADHKELVRGKGTQVERRALEGWTSSFKKRTARTGVYL